VKEEEKMLNSNKQEFLRTFKKLKLDNMALDDQVIELRRAQSQMSEMQSQ
jgi:hypothetical protein